MDDALKPRFVEERRHRPGQRCDAEREQKRQRHHRPVRAGPRVAIIGAHAHQRAAKAGVANIREEHNERERHRDEAEIGWRQDARQEGHGDKARRELEDARSREGRGAERDPPKRHPELLRKPRTPCKDRTRGERRSRRH
jgi:hypothetical protein